VIKPRKGRLLLLTSLATFFLAVVYLLGWSSIFDIEEVQIRSGDEVNQSEIQARLTGVELGLDVGGSMARINTRAIEKFLQEDRWIGRVAVERNWLNGVVSITVSERTPLMSIERSAKSLGHVQVAREFIDDQGTLFTLPGDLASKYREVPALRLESDDLDTRLSALFLLAAIDQLLPTREITVTPISTLVSESQAGGSAGGESGSRWIEIKWGSGEEIELKRDVVIQLLEIKGNRSAKTIDVSNPALPIVR